MNERILVWFSCGAASAVAAKIIVETYGGKRDVEVMNVDMRKDEHPDNERFLADVERWIGREIRRVRNEKYSGIIDVFLTERYIAGPTGAACTKRLKRETQKKIAKPSDIIVVGMTADERDRIDRIEAKHPEENFLWILANNGITKEDCYHIITTAGIKLPVMYEMGFDHNNCMGCVKGGMWHWNQVRKFWPERFKEMAETERDIGYPILGVYLDELDPKAGRKNDEPNIECGLLCGDYGNLLDLTVKGLKT